MLGVLIFSLFQLLLRKKIENYVNLVSLISYLVSNKFSI
jgi:hypothetical protein